MSMRIGFTKTGQYESEGRHKGPVFTAGEVYDCTDDFGMRWIVRNMAVTLKGGREPPKGERFVKVDKHDWQGLDDDQAAKADAAEDAAKIIPAATLGAGGGQP
jgi:hypothetical protein